MLCSIRGVWMKKKLIISLSIVVLLVIVGGILLNNKLDDSISVVNSDSLHNEINKTFLSEVNLNPSLKTDDYSIDKAIDDDNELGQKSDNLVKRGVVDQQINSLAIPDQLAVELSFSYASNTGIYVNPVIDENIKSYGDSIDSNLILLSNVEKGGVVKFQYLGKSLSGKVTRSDSTRINSKYVRVDFSGEQEGYYMSFHLTNGFVKGKIYTNSGSYIYEGDGNNGFVMDLYEYKKLHDALKYD